MNKPSFARTLLFAYTLGIVPLRKRVTPAAPVRPPKIDLPFPPKSELPEVYEQRRILCLDGGGMRGLLTLHVLAEIERVHKQPIKKMFHMVCGTSTGAIIAAGLATGRSVEDLIRLFKDRSGEIFESNWLSLTARGSAFVAAAILGLFTITALILAIMAGLSLIPGLGWLMAAVVGALGAILTIQLGIISAAVILVLGPLVGNLALAPKYTSRRRSVFNDEFPELTMGSELQMDLMITGKDQVTSFARTFFNIRVVDANGLQTQICSHPSLKIAAALTASSAAPSYFSPHGGFIDGGVGSFNNPSYLGLKVALQNSTPPSGGPAKYERGKIALWSIGTGHGNQVIPESNLSEGSLDNNLAAAMAVIEEGFQDSRENQSEIIMEYPDRQSAINLVDSRRFDIALTENGMSQIGAPVNKEQLEALDMDSVDQIPTFETIGQHWAAYLYKNGAFSQTLAPDKRLWDVGQPSQLPPANNVIFEAALIRRLNDAQ